MFHAPPFHNLNRKLVSRGRIRIIPRVKAILPLIALMLALAGCAMPSDKELFETALSGAMAGCDVPADARWLGYEKATVMPLKNMTRANVAYTTKGPNGEPVEAYCTVWLKRVALTWVIDRCEPAKKPAAPPAAASTNAP